MLIIDGSSVLGYFCNNNIQVKLIARASSGPQIYFWSNGI